MKRYCCFSSETTHGALLLTQTTLGFFLLALTLDTRLLVELPLFHLTEKSFLLKLTLEDLERLFNVAINDCNFHGIITSLSHQILRREPQERTIYRSPGGKSRFFYFSPPGSDAEIDPDSAIRERPESPTADLHFRLKLAVCQNPTDGPNLKGTAAEPAEVGI